MYLQDDKYWQDFEKGLHFAVRRNDKEPLKKLAKAKKFDHYLMNLPATATEFLDAFKGLFKGFDPVDLPIIHCYSFSKAKDLSLDTLEVSFILLLFRQLKPL
jgi:tRNA G37 N-methylase Trm5